MGFQKCLYPLQKFDSDTERRFAVILERDAQKWFRPVKGQFQIYYQLGAEQAEYIPDFVAETDDAILMIETKKRDDLKSDEVQAKATAAARWCEQASDYAASVGGKPWHYLLLRKRCVCVIFCALYSGVEGRRYLVNSAGNRDFLPYVQLARWFFQADEVCCEDWDVPEVDGGGETTGRMKVPACDLRYLHLSAQVYVYGNREVCLIAQCRCVFDARVGGAVEAVRRDHDGLGRAHRRLARDFMPHVFEEADGVGVQCVFNADFVRRPLVVDARCVCGFGDVHLVVDDVADDLQHGGDDAAAAGAAGDEEGFAVLEDDGRAH